MLDVALAVMRGERERPPLRVAYWMVIALYLFAVLGHAVAAGETAVADFALAAPLVACSVPVVTGYHQAGAWNGAPSILGQTRGLA